MKVYVVRHGESEANANKCFAGWAPVDLTPKGEQDAREAGELLRHIRFDKIYSSDTLRTVRTCRLALPDAEFEKTPLIREYNVGSLTGMSFKAMETDPAIAEHRKHLNFVPYGGEDTPMVLARLREFIQLLEQRGDETVAVFSHAGTIQLLGNLLLGLPPESLVVEAKNGAVTVFEHNGVRWLLDTVNYRKTL